MKNKFLFVAVLFSTLFAMHTVAQNAGYILYGNGPEGYTDLTDQVRVTALGSVVYNEGVFTGAGLPGRICETGNYLQLSFASDQTMNLTDQFALHVVLQKDEAAAGKVQVSFCKNGWNAARISWEIENASMASDDASDITLRYAARNTDNWNSYAESTFVGEVAYPAAEIIRICAADGESFTISGIYLEASAEEDADPDPEIDGTMRYYLYRGNNSDALPEIEDVTCVDVRPTAYASISCNTASQSAEVTDFSQFTVNGSWCAIDHKPKAAVANHINSSYYLVVRFRTNLADEAVSNNKLRFNLSNGAGNYYMNNSDEVSYNDGYWHMVALALADASGNKPATYLAANQIAFQIHLDGNGEAGQIISIDYAYFTNDISVLDEGTTEDGPLTPTAIRSVHESVNASKQFRNGQLFILRNNAVYDLNGKQVQ